MISSGRHTIVPDDIETFVPLSFGHFTSIASGLKIVSGQHPPIVDRRAVSTFPFAEHGWGHYPACEDGGSVEVGSDVWIGQDVSIMAGTKVHHGAIVGANSVVVKDVLPYTVVVGNPAHITRFRFRGAVAAKLLEIAWWNWTDKEIRDRLPMMRDIDAFTRAYGA